MFSECVRTFGSISSTFTRKEELPWTFVPFSCLSRLLSVYVARKDTKDLTLLATRNFAQQEKGYKATPGTEATARVPKKAHAKKNCNLCKKHGGAYTTHNTRDCRWFEKDGTKKSNFCATMKGRKKPNPTKQSFAQLSKKLD
jgi:hypothetical protein